MFPLDVPMDMEHTLKALTGISQIKWIPLNMGPPEILGNIKQHAQHVNSIRFSQLSRSDGVITSMSRYETLAIRQVL
jgi:hypothetical protein